VKAHGFTLIEVMVVLVIVSIMAAVAIHTLRPDPGQAAQAEAWRMAKLIERLKREANLTGEVLALRWQPNGYTFASRSDDGLWHDLKGDDVFAAHRFDDGLQLSGSGTLVFIPDEDVAPHRWRLHGHASAVDIALLADGEAEVSRVDTAGQVAEAR